MKIKVLLVDDEKELLDVVGDRLEARDLAVAKAMSGDEALLWLKENDADVIVLDILMPGKDGLTTLREIKQFKPIVEVIMLTGNATVQTAIECLKLGAFDYLMKPTEIADLVEKIANAYRRKSEQEGRIREAEIQRIMISRSWG